MRYLTTHTGLRRLRCIAMLLLFATANTARPSQTSVQQTSDESAGQSELVEGLLDLLKEPATKPTPASSNDPNLKKPDLKPADIGLDGEDLGEQSGDPLAAVRQSMRIAAAYLERDITNQQTQNLQRDIALRLEELINQIQAPNVQPPSNPQEQQEQNQQPASGNQQQDAAEQQRTEMQSQNRSELKDTSNVPGNSQPGQEGPQASTEVQLSDPRALQESVWGQLPEQVRKQMQSRMVERFLPSYRAQIEAYFQTLLKEQ